MLVTACGIAVLDIIAADLPHVANPGEVVFGPEGIKFHIGGHTCNVTVDLVQMGVKGKYISAIISIGADLPGAFIEGILKSKGIVVHPLKANLQTSSNLILIVKGEDRRFHVDVGANIYLDPDKAVSIVRREKPSIFYIGAPGWLGKFDDDLPRVCREVKEVGSLTLASVIAPYRKDWSYITPALEYIDILHGNAFELSLIHI